MNEMLSPYAGARLNALDLALLQGVYRFKRPPSQPSLDESGPNEQNEGK